MIIAHRGSSSVAPENTLAAFARAIEDDADGIEFDVQLAKDGVPVVIHDLNLRRTANRPDVVTNLTSTELAAVGVGSWFSHKHPRQMRPEYTNEHVPSLDQVLGVVGSSAPENFVCYVELKVEKRTTHYHQLVQSVLKLIDAHKLASSATIVSFNLAAIAYAKRINPSVRTGALFEPRTLTPRRKRAVIEKAIDCGAGEILLHRLMARKKMIDMAASKGPDTSRLDGR